MKRDQALLFRITKREYDVLSSIAHLENKTPNAYGYEVLRAHLRGLEGNPHVQADLENRSDYNEARSHTSQIAVRRLATPEAEKADSSEVDSG